MNRAGTPTGPSYAHRRAKAFAAPTTASKAVIAKHDIDRLFAAARIVEHSRANEGRAGFRPGLS